MNVKRTLTSQTCVIKKVEENISRMGEKTEDTEKSQNEPEMRKCIIGGGKAHRMGSTVD